jgi:hypothetical protein
MKLDLISDVMKMTCIGICGAAITERLNVVIKIHELAIKKLGEAAYSPGALLALDILKVVKLGCALGTAALIAYLSIHAISKYLGGYENLRGRCYILSS